MIVVIAQLRARTGQEKELEGVLRGMIAPTRKEEGCLQYELNNSLSDPAVFVFYERWRNQADLDAHLRTPHMVPALARASELADGPTNASICRLVE